MKAAIKHMRAWQEYEKMLSAKNRDWVTYTHVYYGEPGIGKTYRAKHEAEAKYGADNVFWLPPPENNRIWWDGYTGQPAVVIDEYYGSYMPQTLLQRICDRYPIRVPTKGSTTPFLAKELWITSNIEPCAWYKKGLGPLARRLEGSMGTIVHMTSQWSPPPVFGPQLPPPNWREPSRAVSPRVEEAFGPLLSRDEEREQECELLSEKYGCDLNDVVDEMFTGERFIQPPTAKRRRIERSNAMTRQSLLCYEDWDSDADVEDK